MNISAPFVPMFYKDTFEQIMPYIDGLFGNESEAEAFAKTFGWDKEGVDPTSTGDVATRIANMFKLNPSRPRMVVITNSSNPAVVAFGPSAHSTDVALTGATGPFPRQEWYPVPAVKVEEIVDTNGAGDAFCAGFLSQLLLSHDSKRCVRAGHYSAGLVLRQLSSHYPEGDLAAMLEEYLAATYSE
ncbi:Ribokinase-like protein [Ramicandelaber brevisporus]|nr:Ribokinase-like protein [Ramicandelaber brevisporus]